MTKRVKTGGRQPGSRNKATLEREARARAGLAEAQASGRMPLDVILTVMRGGPAAEAISDRQYQAAVAAAPNLHPKVRGTTLDATFRTDPTSPTDTQLAAIPVGGSGDPAPPPDDPAGSADLVH